MLVVGLALFPVGVPFALYGLLPPVDGPVYDAFA